MKFYKNLFPILKIISLVFVFVSCSKSERTHFETWEKKLPDQKADSLYIKSMDGNKITMELFAKSMSKFDKKQKTYFDSIKVITYSDTSSTILTCLNAEIDDVTDVLIAKNKVVVINENGILKTNLLIWDRKTNIIKAPDEVTIIREKHWMRGYNMVTKLDMNKIELEKVSARGTIDKNTKF
jgi:LPS export ABC transporter protein LptC